MCYIYFSLHFLHDRLSQLFRKKNHCCCCCCCGKKKSVQQLHSCHRWQHHFVSVENIYKNCTWVKYMKWWSIKSINSLNSLKNKTNNNNKKQLYPHVHTVIVKFVFKPVTFWWGDTLAGTTSSHMVNWKLPIRGVGSFTAALLGFHLH